MSIDPDVADTNQPYVFTNDDPLNTEDPLGLKKTTVKQKVACFSLACLGSLLPVLPSPGRVHVPQPAGSEENRKVVDDQEGVGPHRNPTPANGNVPQNYSDASSPYSAAQLALKNAARYAPEAAGGIGFAYLAVTYGPDLIIFLFP